MSIRVLSGILLIAVAWPLRAAVPGGIEITCDVPRSGTPNFRGAASGQTSVVFRLHANPTIPNNAQQIGADYVVPMTNLAVAKRYTDKYDSVAPRRAMRINAVIGSDGSPVQLPSDGQAWLEVVVGSTAFGCDFAATNDNNARRRLQSVGFAREAENTPDIGASVYNVGAVSIPSGPETAVPFDSEYWDTANIHDASQPTKLTAPVSGKYLVTASIGFTSTDTTGTRKMTLRVNGTTHHGQTMVRANTVVPNEETFLVSTVILTLNVGDYVEAIVAQDSSGPLGLYITPTPPGSTTEMSIQKLH